MSTTLTRPADPPMESTESYDRETGNLIYRQETPHTPTPAKLSSDGGALSSPTVTALFEALAWELSLGSTPGKPVSCSSAGGPPSDHRNWP